MTPKRTAPPVARMLAEKPAAPFPDPEEGEEDGELALLLAEDRTEEAPEDLAGVVVVLLGLPEAGRSQHVKSNRQTSGVQLLPQSSASRAWASAWSAAVQFVVRQLATACWY